MKPQDIQHFLVTYDIRQRTVEVEEFGNDYEAALVAYGERESQLRNSDKEDLDIVLLGADSLDTVKRTHSSYFHGGTLGFSRYFTDAAVVDPPVLVGAARLAPTRRRRQR